MDWLREAPWLGWVAVALVAGLIEVTTLTFVLLMVAGGALGAAGAAAIGLGLPAQVGVFAVVSVLLMITARPALRHWIHATPALLTNTDALLGQQAVVLETVDARSGRIKLLGEHWTARAQDPAARYEVGSPVRVQQIDGATAVVTADHVAGAEPVADERI